MRELTEDTFFENKNDDAHKHVERVLDIVNLFSISGEQSTLRIYLRKPSSNSFVHPPRPPNSLRRFITSSKKAMKRCTKLGKVGCVLYGGTHLDKECPLNEEVKGIKEVKYGEFGRSFPNNEERSTEARLVGPLRGNITRDTEHLTTIRERKYSFEEPLKILGGNQLRNNV
ncbi:hypothetical protein Tco_0365384 [Tanacetum coccineum]